MGGLNTTHTTSYLKGLQDGSEWNETMYLSNGKRVL